VKLVLDAHGSTIHIESQEGAGTEVSFTLPAAGEER
jgi:signal transduction histidine kinase